MFLYGSFKKEDMGEYTFLFQFRINKNLDFMGISIDTIRVGKKYKLRNNGDVTEFQVIEKITDSVFKIKDLTSLDIYEFSELVKFGRGNDYELEEL